MLSKEFIAEASIFDERILKNTAWQKPSHLIKWLKSNGFKKLGSGVYAEVYAKPGHKRVVKVSTTQDDCWIKFAQWAMTKTNNKHLPKIPWVKRYQADAIDSGMIEEFFVTIIERLNPLSPEALAGITDPAVLLGLYHYADLDSNTYQSIENAADKVPTSVDLINTDVEKYNNHPFIKVLHAIENLGGHCNPDLHSGNFMVRNDGTIIVTDPIAAY